ncbi:osmosensitive K+ channel histidine kinase [Lachnospiraceae bacterium JC7]|nr:osmosensitive K+ channel histidine kinase [Lachnospiraceae bacterium JC7]
MNKSMEQEEHILVCISPSPSNPKVIKAAARMAEAFHATLTALYIKPANYDSLPEKDKFRLRSNIKYAEENGASITTIIGDDVPLQIAEYAHISNTTKIVVGRSGTRRRHLLGKMSLTEQIILNAPDVDVYIIPDSVADLKQQKEKTHITDQIRPTLKDAILTLLLLMASTGLGLIFTLFGFSESNIITVFILGVLVISVITVSPFYSGIGSLASVLLFNWFFIEPKFSFHTYETEYVVTFGIMLLSSLITGSLANKLKKNAQQSAREAFRAKVLFDTNQLLQKAERSEDVIRITAFQIITLLDKDVIVYPRDEKGHLGREAAFNSSSFSDEDETSDENEREIADWVFNNQQAAGLRMERYSLARAQYHAICLNDYCYGVIAIRLNGIPLETFENSVFMSILGECALALESLRNAEEKEKASIMVRNEQLRSNLLRSISHDIRTPLTSISGNASNLLRHFEQLDKDTLKQIFSDIYDDSEWLVDLVENLLSISRIENGQMELHMSMDVLNDVIDEALKHVDRNVCQHHVSIENNDDIILVNMDAKLIMQVLINLINNAIKNTQTGSEICIRSEQRKDAVVVSVIDNGPGIPDAVKPHVFEMFYTGQSKVADGRRGLGLGLALCKSIIEAHNGKITLRDNVPTGCCFEIELPTDSDAAKITI